MLFRSDFELIYDARERLAKYLATVYKDKLLSIYTKYHRADSIEIDSISMGKRAIKNRCLRILSALNEEEIISLTSSQYKNSITMTDRIVALDILENSDASLAHVAQADFYTKYKHDTLTMNKYFSILAASEREGTLARVIALQNDEVYDEKVPNLVRSLIGVFARNYKHFHAKNGSGYKFVVDKIIEIDNINAQMASGLAGAFKVYEKMNEKNKKLMQIELSRVVSTHSISKNLYEVVVKTLKL